VLFFVRAQKHPNVISARPLVAAGELVTGPEEGMPTWCAAQNMRTRMHHR
jgi:hypothetical protein